MTEGYYTRRSMITFLQTKNYTQIIQNYINFTREKKNYKMVNA